MDDKTDKRKKKVKKAALDESLAELDRQNAAAAATYVALVAEATARHDAEHAALHEVLGALGLGTEDIGVVAEAIELSQEAIEVERALTAATVWTAHHAEHASFGCD